MDFGQVFNKSKLYPITWSSVFLFTSCEITMMEKACGEQDSSKLLRFNSPCRMLLIFVIFNYIFFRIYLFFAHRFGILGCLPYYVYILYNSWVFYNNINNIILYNIYTWNIFAFFVFFKEGCMIFEVFIIITFYQFCQFFILFIYFFYFFFILFIYFFFFFLGGGGGEGWV